ncbi:MAG: peptidoglycan DD-metalloendopeptidase family protein [bacterium]|nr:peptidoglycan DD-metalloendopeptidase family protein [bacterium]
MNLLKIILILSFLLIITCENGYTGSSIDKEKDKLTNISKTLNKKKQELKKISGQEEQTLKKLSNVEKQLIVSEEKLCVLEKELTTVYKNISSTQRSIVVTESDLNRKQNIFLKRLNAIYKYRGGNLLEILLNTDDFADISKRLYFMTLIAKADTGLINDIKGKKNAYIRKKGILQSEYNKTSKIKTSQQSILNSQAKLKKDRERLLATIRNKKSLYQQEIAQLEQNSLELKELIKKLESQKTYIKKPAIRGTGDLPWPVQNHKVYREFGRYKHPKFDAYIVNKGIDIITPKGETVTSVKEGNVVFASWFKGYGMLVMVDHGNGIYSLYANLANILVSVGEKVSKGTPIGKAGNPVGDEEYNLHFEIRVHGESVNPLEWLR